MMVFSTADELDELDEDYAPPVIAETTKNLRELSVEEAVMELDLTGGQVVMFRHAGHGGLNVVYRRADGNIGWIDAKPAGAATNGRGAPPKRKSR